MWDDGLVSDLRLLDVLRKLGVTAAFAIAPGRHGTHRVANDARGAYGQLVARAELAEFADFEVCNHTNTHRDLSQLSSSDTYAEIVLGREKLEQIYQRSVPGFCYPYGVGTPLAQQVLRDTAAQYARTTQCEPHWDDPLLLHPTAGWRDLTALSCAASRTIVFWGHTYELQTPADWDQVTELYTLLAQSPDFEVLSFQQLAARRRETGDVEYAD
jgi:peptidoglycan/xylan/chitin deacetylase (PgdA/CDA1 family)